MFSEKENTRIITLLQFFKNKTSKIILSCCLKKKKEGKKIPSYLKE
jgi:hypothetical protein